jgi:hypothetical protein
MLTFHRAWVTAGTTMRLAVALGLHTQSQSSLADPNREEIMVQTWWSLHNLDTLLSSITGRPSMLRSQEISTPFPSVVSEQGHLKEHMPATSFPDGQVRLAIITQNVLSRLYTKRRAVRYWAQVHQVMTSMMSELEEWASEAMPQNVELGHVTPDHEVQQVMLMKQYYRTKIFITRPALRRVERCFETGIDDFTPFDLEAAEACIQTAQDVIALLPEDVDLKAVYEKGPWWTIMHNSKHSSHIVSKYSKLTKSVMQAFTVLLIGISCRKHFDQSYDNSVASVEKLVTYLKHMRETNDTAKRAFEIIYNIVKAPDLAEPFVWKDIEEFFSGEDVAQVAPPQQQHVHLPWTGEAQPFQQMFGYEGDGSEYYQTHHI